MSKYLRFETPASAQAGDLASQYGLGNHGLTHLDRVYWNLPAPALYEEAQAAGTWRRSPLAPSLYRPYSSCGPSSLKSSTVA